MVTEEQHGELVRRVDRNDERIDSLNTRLSRIEGKLTAYSALGAAIGAIIVEIAVHLFH